MALSFDDRLALTHAFARTLTLCAVADMAESEQVTDRDVDPYWFAGSGQGWNDTVPPGSHPIAFLDALVTIGPDHALPTGKVETVDPETLSKDFRAFERAGGGDLVRYGHCLAMEWMGHGISRSDDTGPEYVPMFDIGDGETPLADDWARDHQNGAWVDPESNVAHTLFHPCACPGGYAVLIWTVEGPYCADCLRNDLANILSGGKDWAPVGVEAYWEGPPIPCSHCGCLLESEYGDPDAGEDN